MISRAFSTPKNTEEFLALGDYMLHANTAFMRQMIEKVKILSAVACNTSWYAAPREELWRAHAASIRQIQDVTPVFFKFSTLFEAGKLTAEETLARAVGTLNRDLDVFSPNLTFLDRIDDVEKLYEYKLVTRISRTDCRFFFFFLAVGIRTFELSWYPKQRRLSSRNSNVVNFKSRNITRDRFVERLSFKREK